MTADSTNTVLTSYSKRQRLLGVEIYYWTLAKGDALTRKTSASEHCFFSSFFNKMQLTLSIHSNLAFVSLSVEIETELLEELKLNQLLGK